jgi:DNA recombination protein RmuC
MSISFTALTLGVILAIGIVVTIFSLINRTRTISFAEISKKNQELEESFKSCETSKIKAENQIQILENKIELLTKNSDQQEKFSEKQIQNLNDLQNKIITLASEKTRLEAEKSALEEKLKTQLQQIFELNETRKKELEEIHKISQTHFQNLANQILEEKSNKFTEANKTNIDAILKPLGENLESFKKKVEETYDKESKERFSLGEQIKNLREQSDKISSEANNLASALKGQSKKQGNFGEMILETILQNSGLIKNIQYRKEENFKNEEGKNLRPDFIVTLPDEKLVIIDSKTSLTAYEKFYSAETDIERELHLKSHLASIYNHIENLSEKKYDDLRGALDFTMMFIPIEPAYLAAIQADSDLWNYAYKKRILLTSSTNLIAFLKLVNELWRHDSQNKNQEEILRQAGALYDKFSTFVESLEKVKRQIDGAGNAYDEALKQLSSGKGNLIKRAKDLRELGIKTTKILTIETEENDSNNSQI